MTEQSILLLTPKEILQIDGTVIAGILILLTLISITPQNTTEKELEELTIELTRLLNEQEYTISEIMNEESSLTREEIIQRSISHEEKIAELKKQSEQLEPELEELKLRKEVRFFVQPQDWIFYGGIGFTVSAFFAVISSFFQKEDTLLISKKFHIFLWISKLAMLYGFGVLAFIFYKIGGTF